MRINVGFFVFIKNSMDISKGMRRMAEESDAVLLDIRKPQEFAAGHIPGSVNLSLAGIANMDRKSPDKSALLYVYCLPDRRNFRVAAVLYRNALLLSSPENQSAQVPTNMSVAIPRKINDFWVTTWHSIDLQ